MNYTSHKDKHQIGNNSVSSQRGRLISSLKDRGSKGVTTIYARESLDCMHVSMRILELRRQGWGIVTMWATTENAQGHAHRNARYVLMSHRKKEAAA